MPHPHPSPCPSSLSPSQSPAHQHPYTHSSSLLSYSPSSPPHIVGGMGVLHRWVWSGDEENQAPKSSLAKVTYYHFKRSTV
ncbi:unnamed protein product [Zymoseptoria tritici ST99CH_1A5]|uniref:Uncharacterized protein n=1 Tax=Zymoseptoria tritici ST99CH_1A5 TaxID=1276529 RepID=A0A1Y6M311_ZYMTR|nr:unnamed protein product [Zymoseptoria tritici ST99CH_1A5]